MYGHKAEIGDVDTKVELLLKEYFASLGIVLKIEIEEKKPDQHKLFFTDISDEKYYCQIKLNNFPDYFIEYTKKHSGHNKYDNKYRFILNGKNHQIDKSSLSEYYCIYFNKSQTKKIKISFDFLN